MLNPKAWKESGAGQWGYSAAYYNDYRWARQPNEQFSIGRSFRSRERYSLGVRMEFFNVFNRLLLTNPTNSNPTGTQSCKVGNSTESAVSGVFQAGVPASGFGYLNTGTGGFTLTSGMANARNGPCVMRLQW